MKIDDEFSKFLIKEYQYWNAYLHQPQDYLGRCVIWCKREDALDLTDSTPAEQAELFMILPSVKLALTRAFQPDWFNYTFLGNKTKHLHGHVVARYAKPRELGGIMFEDKEYGRNYRTNFDFQVPEAIMLDIKNTIWKNWN